MSERAPLFRAVFEKQVLLLKRYWINTAMLFVVTYLFFAMIFFGGQAVAGAAIEDSLDGIIVGFFLFTVTLSAYFGVAQDLMREAQWGTLEQLFMSPHGIDRVMAVKALFNVLYSVVLGLVMLGVMLATTDRTLSVDVLAVVPIVVVTILSALGIGFCFAGLSLLYKRIENINQLMQFVFIALIATPSSGLNALSALPLHHGSYMLYRSMSDGWGLFDFPVVDLAVLLVTGLGYLALGYGAFTLLVRRARKLGVMGHY